MEVTPSDIVKLEREWQFWNKPCPMLVTLLGMMMDVKEVQPSNASIPILVTLVGMVTDVKEWQE